MIIKNLSRTSGGSGQLIKYVLRYTTKEKELSTKKSKEDVKLIHRHNIRGQTVAGYIKEFELNEANRIHKRKDAVSIHHSIISFSNKDKAHITEKMLKDIAKKFVEVRGMNNLYVITSHHDKSHIHLHACVSGSQLNGKASRMSRQEFADLKLAMDEYQRTKYPELVHSIPRHGKGKNKEVSKEAILENIKNERGKVKTSLLRCLETMQPQSTKHFFELLKAQGFIPYTRSGALAGLQHEDGLKFRFSRLPIDLEKLHKLDAEKATIEQELQTLASLREQRLELGRSKRVSFNQNEYAIEGNETERKTLHELSALREKTTIEREIIERIPEMDNKNQNTKDDVQAECDDTEETKNEMQEYDDQENDFRSMDDIDQIPDSEYENEMI